MSSTTNHPVGFRLDPKEYLLLDCELINFTAQVVSEEEKSIMYTVIKCKWYSIRIMRLLLIPNTSQSTWSDKLVYEETASTKGAKAAPTWLQHTSKGGWGI